MGYKTTSRIEGLGPSADAELSAQPLYAAPALDKGLDILELLSTQEGGLTRREIADRLGRSVGEIFRMIECLTRRSYIVQNDDTFSLGLKLFELAHEFPPMNRLLKEALPRMEALAKEIDQSCHLSMLSLDRQVVVAQVDTPGGIGFSIKIGSEIDLVKSASGRVLLAFRDEAERRRLVASTGARLTTAEQSALMMTISKVATQGFARMKSIQFSGVEAISYPILDLQQHAIAALTVPYVTRLDEKARTSVSDAQLALANIAADLNIALGGSIVSAKGNMRASNRNSSERPRSRRQ
jgi:DNA-binding IclR family transcriptional regulator